MHFTFFDLLFLIPGDFIKRQLQCHSIGYLKEQLQSVSCVNKSDK